MGRVGRLLRRSLAGRAAAAVERPARRHEHGRPPARTPVLRRAVQPDAPRLRGPPPLARPASPASPRSTACAATPPSPTAPASTTTTSTPGRSGRTCASCSAPPAPSSGWEAADDERHRAPVAAGRPTSPGPRAARLGPVLPAVATVALLLVARPPATGPPATQVTAADAASAALVLCCAVTALRRGARPLDRAAALVLGAPALGFAVATIASARPGGEPARLRALRADLRARPDRRRADAARPPGLPGAVRRAGGARAHPGRRRRRAVRHRHRRLVPGPRHPRRGHLRRTRRDGHGERRLLRPGHRPRLRPGTARRRRPLDAPGGAGLRRRTPGAARAVLQPRRVDRHRTRRSRGARAVGAAARRCAHCWSSSRPVSSWWGAPTRSAGSSASASAASPTSPTPPTAP